MRYFSIAWVCVIIMVLVSAAFNFSFGWRLGEHSYTVWSRVHDGWVYGALSIAADGLKVVMGVLMLLCLTARNMPIGLRAIGSVFCGIIFVGATLYSLNSAFGSISTNRTDTAGLREAKATNYDAVKVQLERVQKEQSWLDQEYRAAAAVEADLAGLRQSVFWSRTAGCTNATVADSRGYCQRYSALQAELGTSRRAEELDAKATKLRGELAGMGGAIIADPHAKMLHDLTGYDQQTIVLGWLLLIVALVEGGSTLGPIALAMAHRAIQAREEARKLSPSLPLAKTEPPSPRLPVPAERREMSPTLAKLVGVPYDPNNPPVSGGVKAPIEPAIAYNDGKQAIDDTDPTGPGTPVAKPDAVTPEVTEDDPKVTQFPLKPRQETNAQYRIEHEDTPKKRRGHPDIKDFVRECLGIDKEALAAMKTAIRDRKPLDRHITERLMDSPDCHDLYGDWCDENGLSPKSSKAFSGDLWEFVGLPKGTRKLKGVKGLRTKKGMRFPVFDAREMAQPMRRTA